ncbi:MAG: cytochrome c553 [Paracoccaceae bacterium]|jgi:cytochrome c553
MKPIAFALAILIAVPAAAQEFNLAETVEVCAACHGEAGTPDDPEIPAIWGQQFFYIYTQLKDYKAARRDNEIMTAMAADFDKTAMKQIAQYFADKPWPAIQARMEDGDQLLANRAISGGQCSACHGKWEGDSRIPRLAGQNQAYLQKTMLDFKHEVRMNAPDKISTMQQLSDESIAALSRFLASQ